jgi:ribonuclease VapC
VIVLDASAVVAMLLKEPGYDLLFTRVVEDSDVRISPMSYVETVMALARQFADPGSILDLFMQQHSVIVEGTDLTQAQWAVKAFLLYGKGRHPARLNLGDCFSYAAAKSLDASLLYVGGDFAKTDIGAA